MLHASCSMLTCLPTGKIGGGINGSSPLGDFDKYWNIRPGISLKYSFAYTKYTSITLGLNVDNFKRKVKSIEDSPIPDISVLNFNLNAVLCLPLGLHLNLGLNNYGFIFYDIPVPNIYERIEFEVGVNSGLSLLYMPKKIGMEIGANYNFIFSSPERIKYITVYWLLVIGY